MSPIQLISLFLLAAFYLAYLMKALGLRCQGISANLLGKGNKTKKARTAEQLLRLATLGGAVVQFASVVFPSILWMFTIPLAIRVAGVAVLSLGVLIFIIAMTTMRGNWRAGFDSSQNTDLVTSGIYRFSRNPAFVGFDLLYIGCAIAFPNVINIGTALTCVLLFHVQILGEEKYCSKAFGKEYDNYRSLVRRYF